jgi:linoleoyl-CoA desaturase
MSSIGSITTTNLTDQGTPLPVEPPESFSASLTSAVTARLDPRTLRRAHGRLHRKAAIVGIWYVGAYLCLLVVSGWLLGVLACAAMALAVAAVGFNIQHDANHNAFFSSRGRKRLTVANRVVGWSMFAIGADANRWIYRHGTLHHSAPNVSGVDSDIALGALARLSPDQRHRPWHRFQHIYLWFLYCFTSIEIMFNDVAVLVLESTGKRRKRRRPTVGDYGIAVSTKLAAAAVLLGIPMLFHPVWIVLVGALCVLMASGLLLGIVFQSAHVVEEAEFADEASRSGYRWHEWQVRSSLDFSHGSGPLSKALRWYAGGLDHQTEHHLFPRVPHTAYPEIAPVVTEVCSRYGIPRHVQPSLRAAVASHARHLRAMGRRPPTAEVADPPS